MEQTMKILTANRLLDGEVVWLGSKNTWVSDVNFASILESDEELEMALSFAEIAVSDRQIIEPYAVDVENTNGNIEPKSVKEKIRTKGPTTRLDLGKQAEPSALVA